MHKFVRYPFLILKSKKIKKPVTDTSNGPILEGPTPSMGEAISFRSEWVRGQANTYQSWVRGGPLY